MIVLIIIIYCFFGALVSNDVEDMLDRWNWLPANWKAGLLIGMFPFWPFWIFIMIASLLATIINELDKLWKGKPNK